MTFDPNKPYNDLPLLPLKKDIETKEILKLVIRAHKSISNMLVASHKLPNRNILIDQLSLNEAKDSSEIENIITTNDELYQQALFNNKKMNHMTKEVLWYKNAIWKGVDLIKKKPLYTDTFIKIMRIVKGNRSGIRNTLGTKLENGKGQTIYTPPCGEDIIRKKLKNLDEFLNDDSNKMDPLIKMAIAHYQFEAIHPFSDGNGRTGRIVNILYLIKSGVIDLPLIFLSGCFIRTKKEYYSKLINITKKGEWEEWVKYVLNCIIETSRVTYIKIRLILSTIKVVESKIKEKIPSLYSEKLMNAIFSSPYIKIDTLIKDGITTTRQTSSNYLRRLEEMGILESKKIGQSKIFLNKFLFSALTFLKNTETLNELLNGNLEFISKELKKMTKGLK